MDEECYTDFPKEREILLDDGLPFKVTRVEADTTPKLPKYQSRKVTKVFM